MLLQELGELPLAVEWKRQALRFWIALTALSKTSIFKQAAMDELASAQQSNIKNWAACGFREGFREEKNRQVLLGHHDHAALSISDYWLVT